MISLKELKAFDPVSALVNLVGDYYAHDHLPFDAAAMARALTELVAHPELGRACLLERAGEVVGYTVLTFGFDAEFGGRLATVTDFYLQPEFRGRSLGKEAVAAIEARCKELGVRAIELHVIHGNAPALTFWTARGFEALARTPMSKLLK
jgi:GNAT superfamily N-acetyltransferase